MLLQKTQDHERRLVSWTNYGPTPRPMLMQVCDQGSHSIDRWVPVVHTATAIRDLFTAADARFTFSDYVRALLGLEPGEKLKPRHRSGMFPGWKVMIESGEIVATHKVRNAEYYAVAPRSNGHDHAAIQGEGEAETAGDALALDPLTEPSTSSESKATQSEGKASTTSDSKARPTAPSPLLRRGEREAGVALPQRPGSSQGLQPMHPDDPEPVNEEDLAY